MTSTCIRSERSDTYELLYSFLVGKVRSLCIERGGNLPLEERDVAYFPAVQTDTRRGLPRFRLL